MIRSIVDSENSWLGDNFDSALLYGALVEAWAVRPDEPLDRQQVWANGGWRFAFWWQLGALHRLAVALAPGGGRWEYGCGRWLDSSISTRQQKIDERPSRIHASRT